VPSNGIRFKVSGCEISVFQIEFIGKKVIYLESGCNGVERLPSAAETDRFVWGGAKTN